MSPTFLNFQRGHPTLLESTPWHLRSVFESAFAGISGYRGACPFEPQGSGDNRRDRYGPILKAISAKENPGNYIGNSNSAGMIRQLERAANSVAGGAEADPRPTLTTIRRRTDGP